MLPLRHVQKPPPTVCPAEGPRQSSHLRDARRHAPAPGDKNLSRSLRCSCTPPPAARRVVLHGDTDRGHWGPNDLHAQWTSSTTDPRRRSKRPCTERAHIPTIPTPAVRERQAALRTGPQQAADGTSSSSATSLPGSAASPLPGGQNATDTRPREPAADKRSAQGVGGQPSQHPHPRKRDAMTPVPNAGTGHPLNWACTPRGSAPQQQHSQTAEARRTQRNNGSTTQAAQEQTQK